MSARGVAPEVTGGLDVAATRRDFPLLAREVAGRPVVYFDNAATSLKPVQVVDAVVAYYTGVGANIHRGRHLLSEEASEAYEDARRTIARFINATTSEIVLLGGATEAIGVVAAGLGLEPDDHVLTTVLEHHSNLLPWASRCRVSCAPLDPDGLPDLEAAERMLTPRTRLIAVTHSSNVTGVDVPVEAWSALARRHGIPILVDAAQSVAHRRVDVVRLGCDFLVFSGHKVLGPMGCGVLYATPSWLERLKASQVGGGAVSRVGVDLSYELRKPPWKFESGTPDVSAVLGLGVALRYLERLGLDRIEARCRSLLDRLEQGLEGVAGITLHRPARHLDRGPILSFSTGADSTVVSRILSDSHGIMVRGGHHCAHPLFGHLGVPGAVRVSLQFYNDECEVDRFVDVVKRRVAW